MRPARQKSTRFAIIAALVPALLVLAAELVPAGLELIIQAKTSRAPLLAVPVEPGERFTLHYIHSVDGTPIWEEHSVDRAGNIYVEEERFVMFGAGMGHWPGHGTLTRRGQHQVIENIHKRLGDFVLRVGSREVDHSIIWRDKRVALSPLAAGQAVRIAARRVSLRQQLWRHLLTSHSPLHRGVLDPYGLLAPVRETAKEPSPETRAARQES